MLDQIHKQLKQFGLSEIESTIYLLLVHLGDLPVSLIARKGHLKRTNLYNILEKLEKNGIINEYNKGNVRYFRACEPQKFIALQENKKKKIDENILQFQRVLPLLQSMKSPLARTPQVRFYKGEEEIERLLDETLSNYSFEAYFNPAAAYAVFKEMIKKFLVIQKKKHIKIRELVAASKETKNYVSAIQNPYHQWKILPKKYPFFSDNIIYGNNIAFISYLDEPIGVVIESEDIVRTYRTVFNIMWDATK